MSMQTLTWDVDAAAVAGNSDAYSLALATQARQQARQKLNNSLKIVNEYGHKVSRKWNSVYMRNVQDQKLKATACQTENQNHTRWYMYMGNSTVTDVTRKICYNILCNIEI